MFMHVYINANWIRSLMLRKMLYTFALHFTMAVFSFILFYSLLYIYIIPLT